jgi:hypothetical protein
MVLGVCALAGLSFEVVSLQRVLRVGAWALCFAGLAFEVVSLERVVEGSNIPVPKTLIKSVLNLVMPSVSRNDWSAAVGLHISREGFEVLGPS